MATIMTNSPKPLTITMELCNTDVMILEEIVGEKIETAEQAIGALRVAMICGALKKKNDNNSIPRGSEKNCKTCKYDYEICTPKYLDLRCWQPK